MRLRALTVTSILTTAVLIVLTGCSTISGSTTAHSTSSPGAGPSGPKTIHKILFDYPFTSLPVYAAVVKFAEARAKQKGVELELTNDNSELSQQVSNLNTYLGQDEDAVVSFPADSASINSIAKQYIASGKYWVSYANKLDNQSAFLGLNAYDSGLALGKNAGKWMTKTLGGKGQVLIISDHSMWFSVQRTKGIEDGLKETAPSATVVSEQDGITPSDGLSITTSVLSKYPNLNVVLTTAGDAAQGAYQALTTAGRDPKDAKTYVGGDDPNAYGLERMKDGDFFRAQIATGTAEQIGDAIVDIPLALAAGKSTKDASVEMPLTLITAHTPNLAALIKQYSN